MVAGDKPLSDTSIPQQLFYIRINFTNIENKCNEISTNIKWIMGLWSKVWVFLRYTFLLLRCPISANRLDGPLPFLYVSGRRSGSSQALGFINGVSASGNTNFSLDFWLFRDNLGDSYKCFIFVKHIFLKWKNNGKSDLDALTVLDD